VQISALCLVDGKATLSVLTQDALPQLQAARSSVQQARAALERQRAPSTAGSRWFRELPALPSWTVNAAVSGGVDAFVGWRSRSEPPPPTAADPSPASSLPPHAQSEALGPAGHLDGPAFAKAEGSDACADRYSEPLLLDRDPGDPASV